MRTLSAHTKLYQDFVGIEEGAYHTIVRFYEAKILEIAQLNFDNYFEILVDYTNALFEIGAYDKHLTEVTKVIQLSIEHNIQFYKGEDIYFKSLFQKAASHYNLLESEKAEHILRELIKINPYNELTIRFLKKCKTHAQPKYIKIARATSIFLFLTAALIAAIEVIVVYPFSPTKANLFLSIRIVTLSLGMFVLLGTFIYHRYQVDLKIDRFVKKMRNRK